MYVLTPENITFDVDEVSEYIPEEMFGILNLSPSDPDLYDYFFKHMTNLVTFNSISVELQIGEHVIHVPANWQILLGDEDTGMIEACTIENIMNMKEPHAFIYNPISSMYAKFEPVKIIRLYSLATRWQVPYTLDKEVLVVPLCRGSKPPCAYFIDENKKIKDLVLGVDNI